MIPCPICRSEGKKLALRTNEFEQPNSWVSCGECGFVHLNPRPSAAEIDRFYLSSGYRREVPQTSAAIDEMLRFVPWYYGRIFQFLFRHLNVRAGNFLEIGSGHGAVLRYFQSLGWQVEGIEPDRELARFAQEKLKIADLQNTIVDEKLRTKRPANLVYSHHALEHFSRLHPAMEGLTRNLAADAYVLTVVPTYARNRSRLAGDWMNPEHYNLFTHRSLNQLFADYGLEEVVHTYRGTWREVDELWHLARFTGRKLLPKRFYSSPRGVQFSVNYLLPVRAVLYSPLYRNYVARLRTPGTLAHAWGRLWTAFDQRVAPYLTGLRSFLRRRLGPTH